MSESEFHDDARKNALMAPLDQIDMFRSLAGRTLLTVLTVIWFIALRDRAEPREE
jgi:hypothetical protein